MQIEEKINKLIYDVLKGLKDFETSAYKLLVHRIKLISENKINESLISKYISNDVSKIDELIKLNSNVYIKNINKSMSILNYYVYGLMLEAMKDKTKEEKEIISKFILFYLMNKVTYLKNQYVNILNKSYFITDKNNKYNIKDNYALLVYKYFLDYKNSKDKDKLFKDTIKMINNGIRVQDSSGRNINLYNFINNNIKNNLRDVTQDLLNIYGENLKAEAVQLSAHSLCAVDHLPIQGKIFLKDEFINMQNNYDFQDINKNKYEALRRIIGQWNCKHLYFPFWFGISKSMYTSKQLNKFKRNSLKKVNVGNNKFVSRYVANQLINQREKDIINNEMKFEALSDILNDNQILKYKTRIKRLKKYYRNIR